MIIVCEKYTEHVKSLLDTVRHLGFNIKIVVLKDDGFLPDGICSPYEYFTSEKNLSVHEDGKLFYDFLEVPEFWEIRLIGPSCGAVYDMGRKKATIYFVEPKEERTVRRVEWHTEREWVYKVDFYNKHGLKYASEFRDINGHVESRVFYSDRNQEMIVEQPESDTIALLEKGMAKAFFHSGIQFVEYYLKKLEADGKYVLFIEDENQLSSANVKIDGNNMWTSVLFTSQNLLSKYMREGGENGYRFWAVTGSYPNNHAGKDVLILTAVDYLEGIEYLTDELTDMTFHIAAHTLVSDKLHRLAQKENVKIYPQISAHDLNRLWDVCDFYLDINSNMEIYDAVNTAFQKNLLILGFETTVHHRELLADECVFAQPDYAHMVSVINEAASHSGLMGELLEKQQKKKYDFWNKWREQIFSG